MSRADFARGLITYLFAVVTIGTAVVLVVSALTGAADEEHERRFQRGKEILSLLLGVFGTIVGFYFGTELSAKLGPEQPSVRPLPPFLTASSIAPGGRVVVTTYVSGGEAPYRYAIGFGDKAPEPSERVDASGWIVKELTAPTVAAGVEMPVKIVARDTGGRVGEASAKVFVKSGR
jgi:hypothetical protein